MKRQPANPILVLVLLLVLAATVAWLALPGFDFARGVFKEKKTGIPSRVIAKGWAELSGKSRGKVVFARPPKMFLLDLTTGIEKEVPGVVVAGAAGRKLRGLSPRPFWAPDGEKFVYRFDNRVYVCDESGRKRVIINSQMDCSEETRWSWYRVGGRDWLAGPSLDKKIILVSVSDPAVVRTAYGGGHVEKHCEITGTGRFVVYDDGANIYVAPFGGKDKGTRISRGQNCRPCAAADDRAAWLPSPHSRYRIFQATSGRSLGDLMAPPGEEIYRLNWSNVADFAVHADGAGNIVRMHVRKISTGAYLFVGYGWDPDLWVSP
ncbi:MAG TPA: hypothetical protein VMZ49_11510 [Patescibacteria group bacterium]|nr:hypothetical protein [Patescibacteria group bacterium]